MSFQWFFLLGQNTTTHRALIIVTVIETPESPGARNTMHTNDNDDGDDDVDDDDGGDDYGDEPNRTMFAIRTGEQARQT